MESPKHAMFGLFRPFYYFSRLEISFASFSVNKLCGALYICLMSDVSLSELITMEQKRLYEETGNTPNNPARKKPTSTEGSLKKSLFGSPTSEKVSVNAQFYSAMDFYKIKLKSWELYCQQSSLYLLSLPKSLKSLPFLFETYCTFFNSVFFVLIKAPQHPRFVTRLKGLNTSPKVLKFDAKKQRILWQRREDVALVQFVALHKDLQPTASEWPSVNPKSDYWKDAALYIQQTAGTTYLREGKYQ